MTDPAIPLRVLVNGVDRTLAPGPDRSLLFALRDELGLTGAKPGCGEGVCGACTVLLDGKPERACQVHLSEVRGRTIRTVEGLVGRDGALHPVQQAFVEAGAMQCGYCTAGMVMSTVALLEADPTPDEARIRASLDGNVCRCGTYPRILRAVGRAAELARGEGTGPAIAAPAPSAATDPRATDAWRPRSPWDLTSADERDWFDVLPEGLVVAVEPDPGAGGWSTSAGAWLHVGAEGSITAFTGKVDVGQDNRTSLSLAVAGALRVPLSAVRLVMGDTDLCPYDAGTFGSRSTPDAAPLLRGAAWRARAILIELAAERWGTAAAALEARDGEVHGADGRAAGYGGLVAGLRRVETAGRDAVAAAAAEPAILVERPAHRAVAPAIVTGARRYPSDLSLPGTLHGRVLRPPVPGASLRSVDVTAAAALPGVTIVRDGPFLGVTAANPFAAGRALRAVRAEWDVSSAPSEAGLVTHLRSHPVEETGWDGVVHEEIGTPDGALAAATVHLSSTYTTAYIAHVPLETRVALAAWGDDGRVTVWTGGQVPFGVREQLADGLGVPETRVRVIVPDTGGGFGGKHAGTVALEAARLARAVGRPVKVRWGRGEEFTAGYLRPAAVIDVESGADLDGTITAWAMRNTNSGRFGLAGPYDIPHQRLDYTPADSPLPQGSYRALAATANHFARESHVDELATALETDPLDLRLTHLSDDRLAAVLRAAAERIGWDRRSRERGRGMGIAGGVEKGARVATAVEIRVGADRRLEILRIVSAFECGAIVDPDGLANQIEGATVMGLGGALFEAIHFTDGAITNGSMTDYRVPRLPDIPPIEVVLLDRPDLPSAGGGETPIIAIAPALANAIDAASGVRLRAMPLVPDGVVP